jgi:hypothetical protein
LTASAVALNRHLRIEDAVRQLLATVVAEVRVHLAIGEGRAQRGQRAMGRRVSAGLDGGQLLGHPVAFGAGQILPGVNTRGHRDRHDRCRTH